MSRIKKSDISVPVQTYTVVRVHDGWHSGTLSESTKIALQQSQEWHLSNGVAFPQDKGIRAWVFLFGASLIEAISWSFPACFGVFREFYFANPPFRGVRELAVVGLISDGCLQMLMPLLLMILRCYPRGTKLTMWIGMIFCVVASAGAAFSTKPWQIIMTQGILYGIGAGFLTAPIMVFMSEWFDRRQSFAYGIMFGTSGLFGSFLPTIYTKLLHTYGRKITLLCHGGGVLFLATIALMCISHRVPPERSEKTKTASRSYNLDFVKNFSFYLLSVSVFLQACVLNLPAIYLPSYLIDLKYTPAQGAIALSIFNLATSSGQIGFGLFTDYCGSFRVTVLMSTFIGGLSSILFWGEAKTLASTIIFIFIYGVSSGGYGILRSRFATKIVGNKEERAQVLLVLGILTATRGAGNVVGGFMGESLVVENVQTLLLAYGLRKWMPLTLFVGSVMIIAGVLGFLEFISEMIRRRNAVLTTKAEGREILDASFDRKVACTIS